MGNFLGLGEVNTENISSTIPYMNKLNADARSLVERLNIKNYVPVQSHTFTESENYDMYKLFEKTQDINNNNNNFSDTSPFISSDIYNNLVKQKGGTNKNDSSSDSTSSNSSKSSESVSDNNEKRHKKGKKEGDKSIFKKSTINFFRFL